MTTVTALEAKTRFGKLLARVARGEEVIITRHEKPVARLVPEGGRSLEEVRRAVTQLREIRQRIHTRAKGKSRLSAAEVRSAIDAGRL